ncbi:hypothetical protein COU61_01145 [Candidatus Pacearchaeota archaeon CG10_big_fil_rev_8_21_14_0_10_35_13]|nr:MAG: hypothetical protein COU61_01145 [Candidatus Pacearchaeota archaeon CG10_big_fil_rev_8_21_14_0_10_35_13]
MFIKKRFFRNYTINFLVSGSVFHNQKKEVFQEEIIYFLVSGSVFHNQKKKFFLGILAFIRFWIMVPSFS